MGTIIFGPLQAIVTRCFYLGGLNYRGLICKIQKSFWKYGKCSKRLSVTKSNFENIAAFRIVCWEFSVISEVNSIWERLYLKVAAHELFSCELGIMRLSTLQHQRHLELSHLPYLSHWKLCFLLLFFRKQWDFRKLLTKYMLTFEGFVVGSLENFPLSNNKWPSLVKMSLRWNLRQSS